MSRGKSIGRNFCSRSYPGEVLVDVDGHHVRAVDLLPLLVDGDEGLGRGIPHLLGYSDASLSPARGLLSLVRRLALQLLN